MTKHVIDIDTEIWNRLKAIAACKGISLQSYIRNVLTSKAKQDLPKILKGMEET